MAKKKEKYSAVLLAHFGGSIGLHKFYLGETTAGILYAVFFWTGIPAIIAFIEMLILLFLSKEDFDKKYNCEKYDSQETQSDSEQDDKLEQLLQVKCYLDDGVITNEEYEAIKTKILGGLNDQNK